MTAVHYIVGEHCSTLMAASGAKGSLKDPKGSLKDAKGSQRMPQASSLGHVNQNRMQMTIIKDLIGTEAIRISNGVPVVDDNGQKMWN